MQAVYELLTVSPYLPARAKFTRAELDVYVQGYQRAIAQALKVMKPAAKRWEARTMPDDRARQFLRRQIQPDDAAERAREDEIRASLVYHFLIAAGVVAVVELLALLAALIYHLVR